MNQGLDIIRAYYACFNRKDWEGMCNLLDVHVAHDVNQGQRQTGKGKFLEFLHSMDRHYDESVLGLVVFAGSAPHRYAAEFLIHGTYKESAPGLPLAKGQRYELPVGAFFECKDGFITRISNYYNLQDWLAQVNLS